MENQRESEYIFQEPAKTNNSGIQNIFSDKNTLIIILVALLLLSFLGINLLTATGNILQYVSNIVGPYFKQVLSFFGFQTGDLINKTADAAADVAKVGIDIAEGSVKNVGDLLIKGSQLDSSVNRGVEKKQDAEPTPSESPIAKPITSKKSGWCLVGEYQGKRGCIAVTEQDKCLSGQVFPEQKMCLNPTLSPNV